MTSWSAVAFEDYHRGKPQIERITWHVIEDDTSAITALQTGDIDYMVVPISYWEDVKSSDKFTCVEKESNEVITSVSYTHLDVYKRQLQWSVQTVPAAVN